MLAQRGQSRVAGGQVPLLLLLLPVADPIADEDKEDGGDSGRESDEKGSIYEEPPQQQKPFKSYYFCLLPQILPKFEP